MAPTKDEDVGVRKRRRVQTTNDPQEENDSSENEGESEREVLGDEMEPKRARRLIRPPLETQDVRAVRPNWQLRSETLAVVANVVRNFDCQEEDYARRLELAVYLSNRHHRGGYVRAMRRLVWNLRVNGKRLLELYPNPSTLSIVGDRELAAGTAAEQSILASEERERKLREIIAGRGGLEQSNRTLLRCHRTPACRNSRVEWREVQSRAADEAATITATCQACGATWKLH